MTATIQNQASDLILASDDVCRTFFVMPIKAFAPMLYDGGALHYCGG